MDEKTGIQVVHSTDDFFAFIKSELKPRGKIFTLFNVISLPIILLGGALLLYRLFVGLGVANSSNEFPWGIWIGAVVMVGVAFAGGAYVLAFMVDVLRAEKYHCIVRMAVLNGFLAYVFYAGAIFIDCGRWWNIVNPIIGNKFGVNSVLFLVAWHFLLYMLAELVEISPAVAEWLGLKRVRTILASLGLGAVVFGITLSTLHQSGLGVPEPAPPIKAQETGLKVDVQPHDAARARHRRRAPDELAADPAPPLIGMDGRIQDKGVDPPIPGQVHKANQAFAVVGAHVRQTLRQERIIVPPTVFGPGSGKQGIERLVGQRRANTVAYRTHFAVSFAP